MRYVILLIIPFFILPSLVSADVYYVSDVSNRETAPCDIGNPCTLRFANLDAEAGDTVYLRGGTYSSSGRTGVIYPVNSGTENNHITYTRYQDELVTLTQRSGDTTNFGVYLKNKIQA